MTSLRKTFTHAGIYAVGNLLARAASFLMLPIYTRYLTPSDYGTLELVELTVEIFSIVASAGIINGMSKYYYQYKDENDKNELVFTIFAIILISYIAFCAMGILFSKKLSLMVFGSDSNHFLIMLAMVNLFFSMLVIVPFNYLRTKQKSVFFVVISLMKLLVQLSLNILFVVYLKMGVVGVLYSTCISSLLIGSYLSVYIIREVSWKFSLTKARELMIFGYPFIITGFAAFINTFSDRFFLNKYCDIASVGIYSLGYKFGFLLMAFPISPLFQIWQVQRFEIVLQENYTNDCNKFFLWFTIITISTALFIALTVSDILALMSNSAFWEAKNIVPIILIAYYFQACTDFFNFGIYYSGKSKFMAYATAIAAIAIVVMSFILIPKYGMYGAAWATLICFFVRLLYVYIYSQKLYFIKYNLKEAMIVISTAVLMYLFYLLTRIYLNNVNIYLSILISLCFFGSYITALFLLGVIDKSDCDKLISYLYLSRFYRKSSSDIANNIS